MNNNQKITDESMRLIGLVDRALQVYNLETQLDARELPLNDEITLDSTFASTGVNGINGDNLVVYAVTKFSVVCTNGIRVKFMKLDLDDLYTLQDIIADEYDLDINL